MKRLLFSFLFVLTAIAGWAQEPTTFTVGNFNYVETDAENHYVSVAQNSENAPSGAVVIPSSVTYETVTYTVTSIADNGFYVNEDITEVTIPNTVTSIGENAFVSCSKLTTITLPSTLTTIGNSAFYGCSSLTSFSVPGSVTTIGSMVFDFCSIPTFTFEASNTAITCNSGIPCTNHLYLYRDITQGFEGSLTNSIKALTIGANVTTIYNSMFANNSKLSNIDFSAATGLTSIGNSAFNGCGNSDALEEEPAYYLTTVDLSNTKVTSIGEWAFSFCYHLTTITLPSTLTTIGNSAFYGCSSLTSFSVPGSVTTIGSMVFDFCSIPTFTFEASNTAITCNSGIPCTNHLYLYRDITQGFEGSLTNSIKALTIGANVTTIYNSMFANNSKLSNIDFSAATGLTSIGNSAFNGCGNSDALEEEPAYYLTTVDLSNTKVTSIGEWAFSFCYHLTTITLPSTLTSIGNSAFYECSSLASFSVPSSVTTIGSMVFDYCNNLTDFTFEASNTTLNCAANIACSTNFNMYRNVNLTGGMANGIKKLTFGDAVTGIGDMFYGCNEITSVTVPWASPITIDDYAFSDETFANATLWIPGGTKAAYEAADGWKKFANMDFSSFVVSITGSAHGTLAVGEISSTNNETATTLIDRGENAVFTVTPATGYEASTFTVNGEAAALTDNSYTVENLSADQTVVAGFTAINYTIGYDLAGGSVASANPTTYTIESSAITLNNPTKTGYTFAGWTGTGLAEPTTSVTIAAGSTGNRSYTATWTPTVYNITLTLDGGTATPANPTTYTIETETFRLNNPTKTGHTFTGWKLNGEGDAMTTVTISQGSTGHLAYTATWQINEYTITFDSNGGSAVDPITQDYGTTVTAPDNPTKPGCDFAGWTPELPETMPAEDMTVTATWTELTYTVSITGGGVSADNMNPKYGDDVVITIAEDEDRKLNTLTVNGEDVTAHVVDGKYTIHNVTGNVVVVATFNATKEFITLAQGVETFSCSQDLNFTGSELKAYIAAGYNKAESQVLLVRVYDVPAGTGLYLKGEADVTYKIPYSTSQAYYVNMLKANLTASSIAKTSGDMSNFLLNKVDGEYGFFAPSETATLGAQKAYLQVPTSFMSGSEARAISIAFEDDGTTNISDFELFTNSNEHLYNLKGQRVEKAGRGLYIKNGKKVVIK